MSRIEGTIDLVPLPSGNEWVVTGSPRYWCDFVCESGRVKDAFFIDIKPGFITDLASRPWAASLVMGKWGRFGPGSLIHDWLYWFQERDRAEADRIFLDFMEACGVGLILRRTIWAAVRSGGWLAWNRNRKRREAGESAFYDGDVKAIRYTVPS